MRSNSVQAYNLAANAVNEAFRRGLRHFLPTIVRLALKYGVACPEFLEITKHAYVKVVTQDHGIRNRPANISKTALKTGLSRKEVTRLRAGGDFGIELWKIGPTHILDAWSSLPECQRQTSDGLVPKDIPLRGPGVSLESLAASGSSRDIPITTVLKELIDNGAVERLPSGKLRMLTRYFEPKRGGEKEIERSTTVINYLLTTIAHNLTCLPEEDTRPEILVRDTKVPLRFAREYRELARKRCRALAFELDQWLIERRDRRLGDEECITLGTGFYQIHQAVD